MASCTSGTESERDGTSSSGSLGPHSTKRGKNRAKNAHEVAGDRYQREKTEHGAADDLDISIDYEEPHPGPVEDPTERLAKTHK